MNRRAFLTGFSLTTLAVIVGGKSALTLMEEDKSLKNEILGFLGLGLVNKATADALAPLYDPVFEARALEVEPEQVLFDLQESGVIMENGQLDQAKIKMLASSDPIHPYNSKYYTKSELDVYTLAYHVWGES